MTGEQSIIEKYRGERSGELALACSVTRHTVSAVLYDIALRRRYARCVSFGVTVTAENALKYCGQAILRVMRESGTPASAVKRLGFAAPADITMLAEDTFSPADFFLSPDTEMLVMPMISSLLGGDFTAVLASAMVDGESVLAADVTGGFRAAGVIGGGLKYAFMPLMGGLDGSLLESGMPLEKGAIDEVTRDGGTICYSVIGDGESLGVSVPAALNAVKLMLECGALDRDGIMTDRDLFYIGEDFYISQSDVRAIQSDKAACRAALERFGKVAGSFERAVISGEAFGSENGAAAMAQMGAVPAGLAEKYGWCRIPAEQGLIACLSHPELLYRLHELTLNAEDITHQIRDGFDDIYIKNIAF